MVTPLFAPGPGEIACRVQITCAHLHEFAYICTQKYFDMEFIYVLQSGKKYKIGFTTNPKSRVSTIRTSNPNVKLISIYAGSKDDELFFHSVFKEKRVSLEWFALDDNDLSFIKNHFNDHTFQKQTFERLICALINGQYQNKIDALSAKKTAMFKSYPLTESEKQALKFKNVSVKTGKMIKGVLIESPHFTGKQLAAECGVSLRTVRNALSVFRTPIDGE